MAIYRVMEYGNEVWRGDAESPEHAKELAYGDMAPIPGADQDLDELREDAEVEELSEESEHE